MRMWPLDRERGEEAVDEEGASFMEELVFLEDFLVVAGTRIGAWTGLERKNFEI